MKAHHTYISNWKTVKLGEITEIIKGGTPSRNVEKYFRGNIAWAIPSDITALDSLLYIDDTETHITEEALSNSAARLLPVGTVLLTSRATIGETAIATVPMATNQGFANFICKEKLLNVFLAYYLRYIREKLNDLASGSTFKEVTKGTLLNIEIPFLPIDEQNAIAEALSDVDGLLNALEALIAKKRAIKQAVMQQLLTGKTRLPGFSGAWTEKPLSDFAAITMGQSPSSIFYNSRGEGLPLIQGNADIENLHTIERVWTTQGNKRCNSGDLILTVRAPVGAVAIASKNAFIGRGVCSLKPVGDSRFLFQVLVYVEDRWQTFEQGSTFTAANSEQVGQFHLCIPDDENEQRAIAIVLSDMDAEIAALEQRRDKTRAIKQGMMQQLLTGRVRLSESRICTDYTDDAD